MNKNGTAPGPPSAAPPETAASRGNTGPVIETTQGRDPTLKWCVPDPAGKPVPAPAPPPRDQAGGESNVVAPKAAPVSAGLAPNVVKGALPEAIQQSVRDTSSPGSESIEIFVSDGPAEAADFEPIGSQADRAQVTPPPRREAKLLPPPAVPEAEAITPPPRRKIETVTPPPRPESDVATPPPVPETEAITPPPSREMDAVTPPPQREVVGATPPPKRETSVVPPIAASGASGAPPILPARPATGALPTAPIRMTETAEVGDGDFEVMDSVDTPSRPAPAALTPPPVPGVVGALANPLPPPRPEGFSGAGGSGGGTAIPATDALALPEALSRRPLKKKLKPWYEEVFDENYLRTLPFMTAQQTMRETAFIESSLSLPPEGELLDIGCGYGRHAIELGQRGFKVTGLDLSLPLLIRAADEAQRRSLSVNFVHADMREMTYDSQFAAAYCVLTSFGYFDEDTNLRVASSICRALKPGGRFLVDTINRDYIVSDLPSRIWWEGDGCVVLEEVDFDFHTSRVLIRRSIVFGDGRQVENEISIRVYSLHELGRILRRAGFQVLEVSGSLANKEPFLGAASRHVVIVCERPPT